jgi:hypothetical protein
MFTVGMDSVVVPAAIVIAVVVAIMGTVVSGRRGASLAIHPP